TGIIIKRSGRNIHVRLVWGAVGSGLLGAGGEVAFGVGAVRFTAAASHSRWFTKGVSLKFTVVDENGRENFEKVESYLRSLLTGKFATTEEWVDAASEWYGTKKWGQWTKHIEDLDTTLGPSVDVPVLGTVSAGVGISLAREGRLRTREGKHSNAFGTESITKETDTTTSSAAVNAGVSLGFEHAAGEIAEVGAAAVKGKTLLGVATGTFSLKYNNISYYYDDRNPDKCNWDLCLDTGKVDSAEEALAKCGPEVAALLMPLLDKKTTLANGDEMTFRAALEQMLKLKRHNDAVLLQFELHPAVKREVARCMRRKTQITQQMLPGMKSCAEKEKLLVELARLDDHIRQRTDRNNMKNFVLTGAWLAPMLFQQNDMTVLDVLGMATVTHTGVRLQDVNAVGVPTPNQPSDREVAEDFLANAAGE